MHFNAPTHVTSLDFFNIPVKPRIVDIMKVLNVSILHMKKQTQSDGIYPQTHV